MKAITLCLLVTAGFSLLFAQDQTAAPAPISANQIVELKGTIQEVRLAPGQGMPYLM